MQNDKKLEKYYNFICDLKKHIDSGEKFKISGLCKEHKVTPALPSILHSMKYITRSGSRRSAKYTFNLAHPDPIHARNLINAELEYQADRRAKDREKKKETLSYIPPTGNVSGLDMMHESNEQFVEELVNSGHGFNIKEHKEKQGIEDTKAFQTKVAKDAYKNFRELKVENTKLTDEIKELRERFGKVMQEENDKRNQIAESARAAINKSKALLDDREKQLESIKALNRTMVSGHQMLKERYENTSIINWKKLGQATIGSWSFISGFIIGAIIMGGILWIL